VGIFLFLDEHPESINDGYFVNQAYYPQWLDLPASYHAGAGAFSFADGHSELHRWRYAKTQPPARPDPFLLPIPVYDSKREDFDWVVERMSVEREASP
jgi:prepilin-type processing-associated H-X9-DG protein